MKKFILVIALLTIPVLVNAGNYLDFSGDSGTSSSSSGTPGGNDTQFQYNNGGAFGGTIGFTYNDTTYAVSTNTIIVGGEWTLPGALPPIAATSDLRTVLYTDGISVSWDTVVGGGGGGGGGGGTPGGADTNVQFNDAGTFGGNSSFTFTKATSSFYLDGDLQSGTVTTNTVSTNTVNIDGPLQLEDVVGNVNLYEDNEVDNAVDGNYFKIWRHAAEGDSQLILGNIEDMGQVIQSSSGSLYLYGGTPASPISLYSGWDQSINFQDYGNGNITFFQSHVVGQNKVFRQSGYITAIAGVKYIEWDVEDADDWFHLRREDSNIRGFVVDMPLFGNDTIGTDGTITGSTVSSNTISVGGDYTFPKGSPPTAASSADRTVLWSDGTTVSWDTVSGVSGGGGGGGGFTNGMLVFGFNGGTSAIATDSVAWVRSPFAGTITSWEITSLNRDSTDGQIVVDVWKDTYANYPPTALDTIAGSERPTLSNQNKNQDAALGTWTTAISAGDYIMANVNSIDSVTSCTVFLQVTRSS